MVLFREIFKDLSKYENQDIEVSGWIRTLRASNNFGFIELNDGTTYKNIQIVFENDLENFLEVSKYTIATTIYVKGVLVMTPENKQPFEIKAKKIILEGKADSDFPLQKKKHTFEYLRTIAHLRPRANTFNAVFRVRSEAAYAIHEFFHQRGFVYTHTPIITSTDAEGAGEMFRVTTLDMENIVKDDSGKVDYSKDFFNKSSYLTVTGQLAVETHCMAFRNVYTFGPTFRAEKSNTKRHAAEFWMIEPEMAFCDLAGDMEVAESMLKHVINHVLNTCKDEMNFFEQRIYKGIKNRLNLVLNSEFKRVSYTEAIEILEKSNEKFEFPVKWGIDLQTEHERYLTEKVFKGPVFVTDYPKDIKAFYMRLNDDKKTVAACDLLVPEVGELIGGSQREERYDLLLNRIEELGLKKEDYLWYLDLAKYGANKHAGFGLGFERLILYLTGMQNIRDVIPFPRTVGSAEF